MSETYDPEDSGPAELPPVGEAGDCDRCRDAESGESTGVYDAGDSFIGEDWRVCPCGTTPESEE